MNKKAFTDGLKDGLPIGLGYLSVSFTFGIISVNFGLYWWQAVLISMLCVTSAGQLAGVEVMSRAAIAGPGGYLEMLIAQFTINIRYSFMSISLSQKVSKRFSGIWRWIFGFMVTDEIFAVAVSKQEVTKTYFAGLTVAPYLGWMSGTLVGALLGDILPDSVMNALGIAIYAMFVAIVVPVVCRDKTVIAVVIIAATLSCLFRYVPVLSDIPVGISISICAVCAAAVMAVIRPMDGEE